MRILFALACLAWTPSVLAQDVASLDRRYWRPEVLEVKLADSTRADLSDQGVLVSRSGVDLSDVSRLFGRAGRVERLVQADLAQLDRLYALAQDATPPGLEAPGHLGCWFGLHCPSESAARDLMGDLRQLSLVTHVNVQPIPYPASMAVSAPDDIPPTTPSFTLSQDYFGPAPAGHGLIEGRRIHGARGAGTLIYHLEADWIVTHEDLPSVTLQNFLGPPTSGADTLADHGSGVLGILVGGRNAYGITGAVDQADVRLVSWLHRPSIASTIVEAAVASEPGDICTLISGYNIFQTKPKDWVPAEYFQINFDAIATATAAGLLVVSAAINGSNDLDDPRFFGRFDLSIRDSGAIMVGGTEGAQTIRADFSNYGSRVDCAGWGRDAVTLGGGDFFQVNSDRRQNYTGKYSGTSAATAIVSALVASFVSAVEQQSGRRPTLGELRDLMRRVGSPVQGHIGMRNDMPSMLAAMGIPEGLDVDAYAADLGGSLQFTMDGPAGASAILAVAATPVNTDIGFNRDWHLDPSGTLTVGGFALTNGTATYQLSVPNNPNLQGLDLFWQAIVLDGARVNVSTSVATWVR